VAELLAHRSISDENLTWQKHKGDSNKRRRALLQISSPSALAFACMLSEQACEGEGLGYLLPALSLLCCLECAGRPGEAAAACSGWR